MECTEGRCEKRSRYYVGELTGRRLTVRLETSVGGQTNNILTALLNEERVGQIESTIGPPMGFFGFSVARSLDLKEIEDVALVPKMTSKVSLRKSVVCFPHVYNLYVL